MKISDLTGPALDWAVAKAAGIADEKVTWQNKKPTKRFWWTDDRGVSCSAKLATALFDMRRGRNYSPSTDWSEGGPIIDREGIALLKKAGDRWEAWFSRVRLLSCGSRGYGQRAGPTPLIAAMRCYVASKLGDEVEIPEKLVGASASCSPQ